MSKLDWLKQAEEKKENNPEIEEALVLYKIADTQEQQEELEKKIKELLLLETEEEAEKNSKKGIFTKIKETFDNTERKAPEIINEQMPKFNLTVKNVEKAETEEELNKIVSICSKELKYIEDSRKVKTSFEERKSRQARISFVNNIMQLAKRKIYDNRALEKKKSLKNKIPSLRLKQIKFIDLYKQGFSISNMIKLGYIKKNEIKTIIEKDNRVFEELGPEFSHRYSKWKEKYL